MNARHFGFCGLLGAALAGAGCASREPISEVRVPAMPRVAPATGERSGEPVAEHERVDAAVRVARAGDFAGAASMVGRGADAMQRAQWSRDVATRLAAEDTRGAASFALALPAGTAQLAALEVAARARVRAEADEAVRWALGIEDAATGGSARRWVAEELVNGNPRGALERLGALPATMRRDEMLGFAAAAWTRREPDAAIAWVRGLPEDALRARLVSSVGFELAQTNPERAREVAEMLPAGKNRWLMTGALAQTWVVKDPKAAFAWAKELPAGEAREAAFAGFDTGLGVPASRRMAGAPGTRGGSSRTRGGTAAATALREGDAPGFELWLAGQRAGMTRDEALLEYVRQRGTSNPAAIGQWLSTLPPGAGRDRATEALLENVLANSPRDAVQLLRTLPRSDQTPEMLERTARRLLVTDPGAAERWINESALPEFRKQELLRELRR